MERSLIPACQKTGKMVYLLLSNDTISFVQDENEAAGMIVTAKVKTVRALMQFLKGILIVWLYPTGTGIFV